MKTTTALLALIAACLTAPAAPAQDQVAGTWSVETVSETAPPEGVSLTMTFGEEGVLVITYTLPGDVSQSWNYRYAVEDGQVTITPSDNKIGKPDSIAYDIRVEDDKLVLLEPKPEDIEEQAREEEAEAAEGDAEDAEAEEAAAEDGESEAADDTADDDTAEQDTAEEPELEEEDTRTPVWVLVKS